ncbi:hypothetical protein DXG03_002971 [Asterophora parasitica]|uniref:F-box domain-containing protein n=1 Tax=Asterophora parasitica TaxID=117018 RepID=A0A9P7G1F3_9AGAR|nr:hypothetical protein DXG03_002971 [Asterophora parasitica]
MPIDQQWAPFTATIWSRLPTELMREIILHTASIDITTAHSLRLVSRYTNIWVLPLLFRTLTLTSSNQITRFAATLLPKRKLHIPALKSTLHLSPRPLSSYTIESLALVINSRLPSIEVALEKVAPAFTGLKNLVITGQNYSANAHWIRQHSIYPKHVMILHFGSPHPVNYRDPMFRSVTHLYTCTLVGHKQSFVTDLPQLTHIAVHTRLKYPSDLIPVIADGFLRLLERSPQLQLFVFVLDSEGFYDETIREWHRALAKSLEDKRFIILPFFRHPRMEWECMLNGQANVWDRALTWRAVQLNNDQWERSRYEDEVSKEVRVENLFISKKNYPVDWEIDLMQRDDYVSYEGDPTERREAVMFH